MESTGFDQASPETDDEQAEQWSDLQVLRSKISRSPRVAGWLGPVW